MPGPLVSNCGWIELRPAQPEDAPLLYAWRQEPSVRRFQPLAKSTVEELRAELRRQRAEGLFQGRGEHFQWLVLEDGIPAGWITLLVGSWLHGIAELGYSLTTAAQGRGIMVRALGQLLPTLFFATTLERIEARCAIHNLRSQKVLERLGFQREGHLRGYFVLEGQRVDNYLYALLRADYLAKQGLDPSQGVPERAAEADGNEVATS